MRIHVWIFMHVSNESKAKFPVAKLNKNRALAEVVAQVDPALQSSNLTRRLRDSLQSSALFRSAQCTQTISHRAIEAVRSVSFIWLSLINLAGDLLSYVGVSAEKFQCTVLKRQSEINFQPFAYRQRESN